MENKRLTLLKLIVNSDEEGVNKIYSSIYENKKIPFSRDNFIEAAGDAFVEMVSKNEKMILLMDVCADYSAKISHRLFKEEK